MKITIARQCGSGGHKVADILSEKLGMEIFDKKRFIEESKRRKVYDENENFMKEKPVLPLILSMALPMVLSMLVNSLYNIVDSFFVAQISDDAMTALSLVFPIQNFINAVAIGFGVGMNAVIAFHLGAGNHQRRIWPLHKDYCLR